MPEIKIVTEVAGRVCALPVEVGLSVGDGDDIAFVEAMKMEIPVVATAAGTLKTILVKLDDVVTEDRRSRSSKPREQHTGLRLLAATICLFRTPD